MMYLHQNDHLASEIKIDGIVGVERDIEFDNTHSYMSGGIRLYYDSKTEFMEGLKPGILLEVGFDQVTPSVITIFMAYKTP